MNCLSEGYKQDVDQNWGRMANIGLLGKNQRFWAPQKTHFLILTMFLPRPGKVVQRKKYPVPK